MIIDLAEENDLHREVHRNNFSYGQQVPFFHNEIFVKIHLGKQQREECDRGRKQRH